MLSQHVLDMRGGLGKEKLLQKHLLLEINSCGYDFDVIQRKLTAAGQDLPIADHHA